MLKLKIALLSYRSDPFSGGQGIYLKNLSDALIKRGHKITIFSGFSSPRENHTVAPKKILGLFSLFLSKKFTGTAVCMLVVRCLILRSISRNFFFP